jgi:hypothetical protein
MRGEAYSQSERVAKYRFLRYPNTRGTGTSFVWKRGCARLTAKKNRRGGMLRANVRGPGETESLNHRFHIEVLTAAEG